MVTPGVRTVKVDISEDELYKVESEGVYKAFISLVPVEETSVTVKLVHPLTKDDGP
jgi:phosphopantothenate synthetase